MLADPRRVKRFSREQYFKTQAEMAALFADLPRRCANTVEIAQALQPRARRSASRSCPTSRRRATACACRCRVLPRRRRTTASRRACAQLYPDAAARERERPRYVERLEFEIETIVKMGFPGYFLIVADFINWAQRNGCPVGPGPRLGRRLAGRLLARHHRPRPAALRPAVRALPQSRARVDARLRHRLLPGQPRPRHRLREAEVRRATRSARSRPSARWRRRRRCATSAACSTWATATSTASPS